MTNERLLESQRDMAYSSKHEMTVLKFTLGAYVVVNFLSQVIFLFLLFLGMVMYANEVETKENLKLPEIKK